MTLPNSRSKYLLASSIMVAQFFASSTALAADDGKHGTRLVSAMPSSYRAEEKQASEKIQVDNKLTKEEKKAGEDATQKTDQFNKSQAEAINRVPGAAVTPDDLSDKKAKKKGGFTLNPVTWLFKPVLQLQQQSVRLEQQIMKLTGPIAALQPGMLSLEKRIVGMQGQMQHVEERMGTVDQRIGKVQEQMSSMQSDISAMRQQVGEMKKPISDLRAPIVALHDPLLNIAKPVSGVELRLENLDKQLNDLKTLISLVLTAIFIAAGAIAVGTPVAAILVWRNRAKFLPKPKPSERAAEQALDRTGKLVDHELQK